MRKIIIIVVFVFIIIMTGILLIIYNNNKKVTSDLQMPKEQINVLLNDVIIGKAYLKSDVWKEPKDGIINLGFVKSDPNVESSTITQFLKEKDSIKILSSDILKIDLNSFENYVFEQQYLITLLIADDTGKLVRLTNLSIDNKKVDIKVDDLDIDKNYNCQIFMEVKNRGHMYYGFKINVK